jgi:sensor histidine kinase regulating citrate/malate metabolism
VSDNGIGISPENITKIFSFGFTTKKDGHGFGLHNSANISKELGGSLEAESDGLNKGSMFILKIPLKIPTLSAKEA